MSVCGQGFIYGGSARGGARGKLTLPKIKKNLMYSRKRPKINRVYIYICILVVLIQRHRNVLTSP